MASIRRSIRDTDLPTHRGVDMKQFEWIFIQLLPSLGFILALVLLSHILKQRRSPTSTIAWLMAVIFIPYIGVPLYILFGGRKMARQTASKRMLPPAAPVRHDDHGLEHQLASLVYRGGFPPTRRNRVKLLLSGEEAFHEMMHLIESAEYAVYVATFILGKGPTGRQIVDMLARRAAEGLQVYLLLDALGSVKINRGFLAPLHQAGGRTAFFMPMFNLPFRGRANLRNHRKMVIIDRKAAIVGGMNLAHQYMGPRRTHDRWHDISTRITGPAASQAFEIFRSDWEFAASEHITNPTPFSALEDITATTALQFMASGPDVENDALREALMISLFRAHNRVWIVTPYFVPDELLVESLCMAAQRGVDLRLITPERSNHRLADWAREGYLSQLQEAGAKIYLYLPRMLHAKALIIDESVALVGSANMDMRSLLLNYEVGLCIYSTEIIHQLEHWMMGLMNACRERQPHQSPTLSLIEGVSRLFAPLL
jgi:cardiolipin synthase